MSFCVAPEWKRVVRCSYRSMIRVVIIEDQALLANVLDAWLARQPGCKPAGVAADGAAGWDLCMEMRPDAVLVDIGLPDIDGLELARRLMIRLPALRVLVMSGHEDVETLRRVWQSGVHGYVEKTQDPAVLWEAVRAVASGKTFFGPAFHDIKKSFMSPADGFRRALSPREEEVLACLAAGQNDEQTAAKLGMAVSTVSVHRKHIRQKLGIASDRELQMYARQSESGKEGGSSAGGAGLDQSENPPPGRDHGDLGGPRV